MSKRRPAAAAVVVAALVMAVLTSSPASAGPPKAPPPDLAPIVFVHGQSGSAQQFETQAMRFTSNGYPQDLLFAFEYDTNPGAPNRLEDLDAFVDDVLDETGADQIYAIGHSRGTGFLTSYLDPDVGGIDGSAKVAKYVNIDGASPDQLPGGVPTIGIWGEWNTAGSGFNRNGGEDAQIGPDPEDNFHFGDKSHTQVATSAEAFARMFEFFTGSAPRTSEVGAEPPGRVTLAGRAVVFPANVGRAGATVELWRVRPESGQRIGSRPRATFPIDDSGDWGPVRINGTKHYELTIVPPDGNGAAVEHHFYFDPFARSDHFVRLNTGLPGEGIGAFVPTSDESVALTVVRQKEFWGDQGTMSDELRVDGLDLLTSAISPRAGVNLALFAHDDGLDETTDLDKGELFPFSVIPFLTAADVFMPSAFVQPRSVALASTMRGAETTVVNFPNWSSNAHRVTVQFDD